METLYRVYKNRRKFQSESVSFWIKVIQTKFETHNVP